MLEQVSSVPDELSAIQQTYRQRDKEFLRRQLKISTIYTIVGLVVFLVTVVYSRTWPEVWLIIVYVIALGVQWFNLRDDDTTDSERTILAPTGLIGQITPVRIASSPNFRRTMARIGLIFWSIYLPLHVNNLLTERFNDDLRECRFQGSNAAYELIKKNASDQSTLLVSTEVQIKCMRERGYEDYLP